MVARRPSAHEPGRASEYIAWPRVSGSSCTTDRQRLAFTPEVRNRLARSCGRAGQGRSSRDPGAGSNHDRLRVDVVERLDTRLLLEARTVVRKCASTKARCARSARTMPASGWKSAVQPSGTPTGPAALVLPVRRVARTPAASARRARPASSASELSTSSSRPVQLEQLLPGLLLELAPADERLASPARRTRPRGRQAGRSASGRGSSRVRVRPGTARGAGTSRPRARARARSPNP